MSDRISILNKSLEKKKAKLDAAYSRHFDDVRRANGQPINDKRNGAATFKRWDKQSDSIRKHIAEVEKTERAIERENGKIEYCDSALHDMPRQIVALIDAGVLIQWRRHPNTFFVDGVDRARISFKKGILSHRYVSAINDAGQYRIFRDLFNNLKRELAE